jgi:hypothetical protein
MKKKTPDEALGFLLQNHLTKDQYNNMKRACTESGCNLWPNYNEVVAAKSLCRPNGIILQEHCAEVSLQDLLNHTAIRILEKVQYISVLNILNSQLKNLICALEGVHIKRYLKMEWLCCK